MLAADLTSRLRELHLLTAVRVAIIIVVAVLATLLVHRFVARFLRRLFGRTLPVDRQRLDARGKALSSALRAALVGVIWAVAVITVISELGVSVGGFVATATVVGGAVAFGAQTLVRDLIAGFFVLSDDQYGVGDEVDLGHASGVVERVTLRTARLRDSEGRIWYVPHGNVQRVANLSKQAVALLDVDLARTMSLTAAMAEVNELVAALVVHPQTAPFLQDQPVVQGVAALADDRFVIRVTAPTVPGHTDAVRRVWRVLLLEAFAAGRLTEPPLPNSG